MQTAIETLIQEGESETLEFKESFGKEAVESIAAFANGKGGYLCIGVNNKGKITGVAATEEQITNWLNQIDIFDEHIEFTNPGGLFGTLELESLKTDFYRASHRNKLLAETFYLIGEVEKYGTGFIRIRECLAKEAPGLEMNISSDNGGFWAKLAPMTSPEKTSEKILRMLAENPSTTIATLSERCGVSSRSIERNLKQLQKDGLLKRVGPNKGGVWNVNKY